MYFHTSIMPYSACYDKSERVRNIRNKILINQYSINLMSAHRDTRVHTYSCTVSQIGTDSQTDAPTHTMTYQSIYLSITHIHKHIHTHVYVCEHVDISVLLYVYVRRRVCIYDGYSEIQQFLFIYIYIYIHLRIVVV